MERIQSVYPERIAWCCADHGITPGKLASELGIAAASMERVMAGHDGMTFIQLRKVAEYFSRGVLFFLEHRPVDEVQAHSLQFRTLANEKPELSAKLKALIKRVEKQRAVYLSLCEDLDDTNRPRFSSPNLPTQDPRKAAHIVRQWLNLRDQNNFDTYRTEVEARGVLVFSNVFFYPLWENVEHR